MTKTSVTIGEGLDWNAPWDEVTLAVELPFWLMVTDCPVSVTVADHSFTVTLDEHCSEIHAQHFTDSRSSCVYQGPFPPPKGIGDTVLASGTMAMLRKCKTCLRIETRCNADALAAATNDDEGRRWDAHWYFAALCSAHIPVVNRLLQAYILETYDPLVHEVSPWDVPVWFVRRQGEGFRVVLLPATDWDMKPVVANDDPNIRGVPFEYASPDAMRASLLLQPTPGESELAHAMHLRVRGDYSGAVRRAVTALEVLLEARLSQELSGRYTEAEVEQKLRSSQNDFPGRLRQYQKLTGRTIPATLNDRLDTIRGLRHDIVHKGRRLTFEERGIANHAIDNSKFAFQWLENSPDHLVRRERFIAQRQIGVMESPFNAGITPDGVVVYH